MLYIEIIKVRDLDVLPNARYTQSHGKWAEKDRNFAVTLTIEPVFMRVTREGVKIMVVLIGLIEKQLPNIPSNVLGLLRTANQIELAQWYSTADVFVNPTYEETFGLTTVEAQACGTPVVVYETDGCPETVAPGNGRLIPQGDMQALENAVRDVADSNWRADPKKMVRFDKDTVYQGYVKLYENVLSTLGKGRVMAT